MIIDDVREWADTNPDEAKDFVLQWLAHHPTEAKALALWWRNASGKVLSSGEVISEATKEEIVKRIKAGEWVKDVADSLGIPFQRVGGIFKKKTGKWTNDMGGLDETPPVV